jgi:hypothetical protein
MAPLTKHCSHKAIGLLVYAWKLRRLPPSGREAAVRGRNIGAPAERNGSTGSGSDIRAKGLEMAAEQEIGREALHGLVEIPKGQQPD